MKFLWAIACLSVLATSQAAAGDAAAGKAKAQAMCQTCHGLDGIATIPMAAHLSGQQETYLIAQLEAYRDGKRQHEQMSIIAKILSDADIENLAAWYSQINVIVEIPE
ncbi:MAG: cytochrome c [Alphaproteobacteria bacterium]|jgi:cytochrome c553